MAVIREGILVAANGSISFGNHEAADKIKVDDFEHQGAIYSVRTHKDVTRLEKNNDLLFEAVPGATIHNFVMDESGCDFEIEGKGNCQVTICLEPQTEYSYTTCANEGSSISIASSRASGKHTIGVTLSSSLQKVSIKKS